MTRNGVLRKGFKALFLCGVGFIGGCLAPWFVGWLTAVQVGTQDAVSIANTYIVFTTIIFAGMAVVLSVIGYVFAQQFADSKKILEAQFFQELGELAKTDETIGIGIAEAVIENPDVKRHIDRTLREKLGEILAEKRADISSEQRANAAMASALDELSSQLDGHDRKGGE